MTALLDPVVGVVLMTLVWSPGDRTPEATVKVEKDMGACVTDEVDFVVTMNSENAGSPPTFNYRYWARCLVEFPENGDDPAQKGISFDGH